MIFRRSAPPGDRSSPALRRQRIVTAIAVACAVLSIAGMASSRFVKSPKQIAAESGAPPASVITAAVTNQVLSTTLIFRGTVGTSSRIEITPAVSGTSGASSAIVSAVRVRAGQTVKPGKVLLEVSGRPLIVLRGAVPAYRDLKPGDQGADVRQLQTALASLGYFTGTVNGSFGASTKTAITRMYDALGYDVPDTGGPQGAGDRAALQAAHQAVVAARRAVEAMERQIAAAADASSNSVPDSSSGAPGTSAEEPLTVQLRYLREELDTAISNEKYLIAHTGPQQPAAEVAFIPRFPARVASLAARVGAAVTAPLVTISTGDLVITAQLDPNQAKLLRTGMPAQVDSEVLDDSAKGEVSRIDPVTTDTAEGSSGERSENGSGSGDEGGSAQVPSGAPYVPVTIDPDRALPTAWNGQDVRITVTSAKTDSAVLAVPVSAISTRSDGRTVVTVIEADGGTRQVVVRAGVSADGFVQVTPVDGRLSADDSVSVGR